MEDIAPALPAFLCPITSSVMRDPVSTADGHTYERAAIEQWFQRHNTSPSTGARLRNRFLRPNHALRQAIEEWEESYAMRLQRSDLELEANPIASGCAKIVFKGQLRTQVRGGPPRTCTVAVLKLRHGDCATEAGMFLKLGRHPRLVRFMGQCIDGPNQLLVTEFAELGSLCAAFERLEDSFALPHKMIVMQQVAQGMEHLAAMGIIHRDLAARNVLVFAFDEQDVLKTSVKVADYGLATSSYSRTHVTCGHGLIYPFSFHFALGKNEKGCPPEHTHGTMADSRLTLFCDQADVSIEGELPVRYMSEEALQKGRFSQSSDIWAFGVTCWEILTLGNIPYYHLRLDQDIIEHVCGGGRPPRQQVEGECPDPLWDIVESCWSKSPKARPTFSQLVVALSTLAKPAAAGENATSEGAGADGAEQAGPGPGLNAQGEHAAKLAEQYVVFVDTVAVHVDVSAGRKDMGPAIWGVVTGRNGVVAVRRTELRVRPSDTIAQVKCMVQDRDGVPFGQQRLVYVGEELQDWTTLAGCKVLVRAVLYLFQWRAGAQELENILGLQQLLEGTRMYLQGPYPIRLDTRSRRRFELQVQCTDTVAILKRVLEETEGVPVDQQNFRFLGKWLEEEKTLLDYGIREGSAVYWDRPYSDAELAAAAEARQNRPGTYSITIKTMSGQAFRLRVLPSDTALVVKDLIEEVEGTAISQQRLVHDRRSLEDDQTLAHYGVREHDTVLMILRMTGDIGEWGEHSSAVGTRFLQGDVTASPAEAREILRRLGVSSYRMFECHGDEVWLDAPARRELMRYADRVRGARPPAAGEKSAVAANRRLPLLGGAATAAEDSAWEGDSTDSKVPLSRDGFVAVVGEEAARRLDALFRRGAGEDGEYAVWIRRVEAVTGGRCINFHTDVTPRTMQVPLNDEAEYDGGRVVYATEAGLVCPPRRAGSVIVHDSSIAHGVSLHTRGVRYSLFFLQRRPGPGPQAPPSVAN